MTTPSRDAPRFTVVVPAFNAERTVASALRSVLTQAEERFEIVVVDDGSTDRTASVVRSFDDRRVRLVQQANRGLPAARNAGIAVARADLVSFLDADDMWMPTYLSRMGAALAANPDAALAYCDAWVFDDATGRIRRQSFFERRHPGSPLPTDPGEFLLVHLRDNFFYVGTTVRRSVLAALGGFREEMTSLEDYELWLRIEAGGHRVVEVPEKLALYRFSDGQMSKDAARMSHNLLHMLDLVEARADLPVRAREIIAARRAAARRDLVAATQPLSAAGVRQRMRAIAGRLWHRLPGQQAWLDDPPAAIRATFGDPCA